MSENPLLLYAMGLLNLVALAGWVITTRTRLVFGRRVRQSAATEAASGYAWASEPAGEKPEDRLARDIHRWRLERDGQPTSIEVRGQVRSTPDPGLESWIADVERREASGGAGLPQAAGACRR